MGYKRVLTNGKVTPRRTVHRRSVLLDSTMYHSAKYVLMIVGVAAASLGPFEELYTWKQIDYQFPNNEARDAAIASSDFIQSNNLPVGLEIWGDKVFVTVPRLKNGIPANLNYISLSNSTGNKSPALIPYPSWEANDIHRTAEAPIVSIFRLAVDACDRLWGIDTGINDVYGSYTVVQPARIVVIDLKTDKIIRWYPLTEADQKAESFFANLVVDVEANKCDEAYAYISDLGANGLVVYSWADNKSWRVSHNFFAFDPLHGDFNVKGINFQWTDGVFGMALSNPQPDGFKNLYFHAMASTTEFVVSTSVLRNEELATSSTNYYRFQRVGYKGEMTQSSSSALDTQTGVIFFGAVNKNGIACWNSNQKLEPSTFRVVAQDDDALVFPNDVKIDRTSRHLYALTDCMPIFQYASLDFSQTNFRILRAPLDEAAKACQ